MSRLFLRSVALVAFLALASPAFSAKTPAKTGQQAAPATAKVLFREPIQPVLYELPSGALATWRTHAARKPALVLFSSHPYLHPLSSDQRPDVMELLRSAPSAEIVRRGKLQVPDPALITPQAVSAAIEAGYFSEMVLVMPTNVKRADFSLETFQQSVYTAGFFTEEEALALKIADGVISGTVRGLPFRCVHPEALPAIDGPVIAHIDLGYFNDIYANDVKTPVYTLLFQTASRIRDRQWQALAVTLSYSNLEIGLSLESRFILSHLAEVLRHPEYIDGGAPANWSQRIKALYAEAMFSENDALELFAKAAAATPPDPADLYAWSLRLSRQKRSAEAMAALDRAVALDSGYGLAYLDLAENAAGQMLTDVALNLLGKAGRCFPDNPFIGIRKADLLLTRGRKTAALPLIIVASRLPWSPRVHQTIPEKLEKMAREATDDSKSVKKRP